MGSSTGELVPRELQAHDARRIQREAGNAIGRSENGHAHIRPCAAVSAERGLPAHIMSLCQG